MKIASDAFVISNITSDPFFVANLDTFGSNSGSPVINTDTYCAGENATKMALLAELIPESAATGIDTLSCFPTLLFLLAILTLMQLKPA
jgi:hypothetical protein